MAFTRITGDRDVREFNSAGTIAEGDCVQFDENGEVVVGATGAEVLGVALEAATSSTTVKVDVLKPGDEVDALIETGTMAQTEVGEEADINSADGQPLASASHTVPGTGATTYSNILSGAGKLSEANLSSLIQQGKENNVSDAGTLVGFNPDMLIVPDNELMVRKALELTGSDKVPESNNNAVNVYSGGRMKVVVLKHGATNSIGAYDTAQQYHYAVANSAQLKRAVKYSWALRPSEIGTGLVPKFREQNLDSNIYSAARCAFGAPRWLGIYYSMSTTAPDVGSAA